MRKNTTVVASGQLSRAYRILLTTVHLQKKRYVRRTCVMQWLASTDRQTKVTSDNGNNMKDIVYCAVGIWDIRNEYNSLIFFYFVLCISYFRQRNFFFIVDRQTIFRIPQTTTAREH